MISGTVNRYLEATIRLILRGPGSEEIEVEAVIDTGSNGFVTLSPALAKQLALAHLGHSRALLPNGQIELLDLYEVNVLWDGEWRRTETSATDTDVLVGMSLLDGYNLNIQAIKDGRVAIERLP